MKTGQTLLRVLVFVGGVVVLSNTPEKFGAYPSPCAQYDSLPNQCTSPCQQEWYSWYESGPGRMLLQSLAVCSGGATCHSPMFEDQAYTDDDYCCGDLTNPCSSNFDCCPPLICGLAGECANCLQSGRCTAPGQCCPPLICGAGGICTLCDGPDCTE